MTSSSAMKNTAMALPWTLETVPHAVLDILRGCNVRCRDCFNTHHERIKPLAEVEEELKTLMRLRSLHSVSILGGEITLHPELTEIVRMVRSHGLFVELFTNGVDLTPSLTKALSQAGANVIFLHIENGQMRADLAANAPLAELRKLRAEKAAMIIENGMDAGLAVTIYPQRLDEAEEAVRFTLESPHITYLLGTLWRDVTNMQPLSGNLEKVMFPVGALPPRVSRKDNLDNVRIQTFLEDKFDLTPFGFVGSNVDAEDPRWLSYLVGTVHAGDELCGQRCVKPTRIEKMFLESARRRTGRYPFYQDQNARRFGLHLLLNGLAGGGIASNLRLLFHSLGAGKTLRSKRLLFQCPAMVDDHGRVTYCRCCPDAVVHNGSLVPLCISDRMTPV